LSILPEPQASLALGFLVGLKSQLPGELSEQLRVLGLTHIVVASGYNLTILVRLSRRLLARFSKYQAMLAASAMIAAFVTITGFSASMSRAALVTSLALAAWYYGRRIHPVVLLLVASAITAMVNPLFLWSDVGWWLSFLAFAGVMLGAPLVQRKIFGDKKAPTLVQIAIETLCAELLTLPLILFVFGDLPLLALLANVLVVPFIPLVMLLTFVAGAVGWFVPMIAAWVAQPALWVLTYMTNSVSLLSQLPWATMHITITATGMVLLLLSVCLSGFVMYKKMRFNYLQTSVIE
jgi:competence protein ComEC